VWSRAADGVNLRIALWPRDESKGTVLWFTGRTEYIEKYGLAAREMADRGFASATLDWRGQGLSDRLLTDPLLGHVAHFQDYQQDVLAFVRAVADGGLAGPYFLVAHSLGGAIGLRSLINGLNVSAAVFSAPMWGIKMHGALKPVAKGIGAVLKTAGQGERRAPGTDPESYVVSAPFEGNLLTSDEKMYRFMVETLVVNEALGVAGPTVNWVHEALSECRALSRADLPPVPTLIALGSKEDIVEPTAIHRMAARWPAAKLKVYEGARHEVMMETPELRAAFYDDCAERFGG